MSFYCLRGILPSDLMGRRGYFTFILRQRVEHISNVLGLVTVIIFFFHLVNVKVHFRGRLELSLKSICSFRPHKIPLFMLWRGSDKGYQDKLRIVFHQMLRTALHHTNPEKILFRGLPWSRAVGSWTDPHPTEGTQTITQVSRLKPIPWRDRSFCFPFSRTKNNRRKSVLFTLEEVLLTHHV